MKRYLISLNGTFIKEYIQKRAAIIGFQNVIAQRIEMANQSILLVDKDEDYRTIICEFYN